MDTLGIINGIIDEGNYHLPTTYDQVYTNFFRTEIQAPYYPEFAMHNTYGRQLVPNATYNSMKKAWSNPGGCHDMITACKATDRNTILGQTTCANATSFCRAFVEEPYYNAKTGGVYDIRHPFDDPTPPTYFVNYLNTANTQDVLGVNINYTADSSSSVGDGFASTGDFVWPNYIEDLEEILGYGVRVALIYGDADYICNWFGGEAVSLAANYTHAEQFRAAGYTPFLVNGTEYGETRQYGNFSFTRIYESGHEVPYYQPEASLELFRRVLNQVVVADGSQPVTGDYSTNGTAKATHTESYVPFQT